MHGDKLHIHSLTSSADDGDFSKNVEGNVGVMLGSDPVVLVVKKTPVSMAAQAPNPPASLYSEIVWPATVGQMRAVVMPLTPMKVEKMTAPMMTT